jgi:hypothetical protein
LGEGAPPCGRTSNPLPHTSSKSTSRTLRPLPFGPSRFGPSQSNNRNSSYRSRQESVFTKYFCFLEGERNRCYTPLTTLPSKFFTKLVQTKNSILVSPTKKVNIAFVHLASESDEVFGWQGVFNFYLLRYRSDEKLDDKYLPYPCLHENFTGYRDNYSYRMFLFLNRFRKELSRRIGPWGIGQAILSDPFFFSCLALPGHHRADRSMEENMFHFVWSACAVF